MSRSNTVFIGRKPVLNYARVVEVTRNRFMADLKVSDLSIWTAELTSPDRPGLTNVITIEIKLHR